MNDLKELRENGLVRVYLLLSSPDFMDKEVFSTKEPLHVFYKQKDCLWMKKPKESFEWSSMQRKAVRGFLDKEKFRNGHSYLK